MLRASEGGDLIRAETGRRTLAVVYSYFNYPAVVVGGDEMNGVGDLPLGLGCIRAFARADLGIAERTTMTNRSFAHETGEDDAVDAILADDPDLVAFSCFIWNHEKTMRAAALIKERSPRTRIVVGGPHVPRAPEDVAPYLGERPQFDVAVRGEGEAAFAELLKALLAGSPLDGIAGLAFRDGEAVRVTPPRDPPNDLTGIPSPYLTGDIRIEKGGSSILSVEAGRGCPFRCTFCFYHGSRNGLKYFPIERVRAELNLIAGAGHRGPVYIADPNIAIHAPSALRVLEVMRGTGLRFLMELMADRLSDELISAMGKVPGLNASIGIETVNPAALKIVDRPFNERKAREAIGKCLESGVGSVILEVILGLPGDDYEGFKKTLDWTLSFRPVPKLAIFDLALLPNTTLLKEAKKHGIETDPNGLSLGCDSFPADQIIRASRLSMVYNLVLDSPGCVPVLHAAIERGGRPPSEILEAVVEAMRAAGTLPPGRVFCEKTSELPPFDPRWLADAADSPVAAATRPA